LKKLENERKHITLITTWFPPQNGIAVNRMFAFAKYLDKSKYDVSVITIKTSNEPNYEIIENIEIHRAKNNSLIKTIHTKAGEPKFIHNLKVLWNTGLNYIRPFENTKWKNSALKLLNKLHSQKKIDLIISSYSPLETHLVANEFCINNTSVLWIADMRDELSKNPHISGRIKQLHIEVEKKVNKRANAVTTVSEPILNDFRELLPDVKYFEEIRNGYDHDVQPSNNFNEVFTISYAGTFYGTRKPDTFFMGLSRFVKKYKVKIRLKFIGTNKNFSIPSEFESCCEFTLQVPHQKAIELISVSDANLLVLPPVKGKGVYTGKIFDYISVLKPIIAVVDATDVAAKLITDHHLGFVADFNDIDQIEKAIEEAYTIWKEKKKMPIDEQKVNLLHRKYQVKKLEQLIDKLLTL